MNPRVSTAEIADNDAERQEWFGLSAESLGAAYGESEPDYNVSMIKESNLDYRP